MTDYTFDQLVNIQQIRMLLESHHCLSEISYGLLDADGNELIVVGWQDICVLFHRVNPCSAARCRESDTFITSHLHDFTGEFLEYRCKNGMIDIAMPIVIDGRHLATFYIGQFFYDDDMPDTAHFRSQAEEFSFDSKHYLSALGRVPVFSREYVRGNALFMYNMVQVLAETGLKNLRIACEAEKRKQAETTLVLMGFTLDQVHEAAFLLDDQGRFHYVNQEACRSLGYSRVDLLGLAIPAINPDYPVENIPHIFTQVLTQGPRTFETRHRTRDGHIFPVEITSNIFEHGGVKYILSLVRDITERKRATEALLAKQQKLTDMAVELSMAEERERRRIAAELHDHIGQTLLLGKIKLNALIRAFPTAIDGNELEEVMTLQNQAIRSVRSLTQQLSPPILSNAGLEAALKWLGERMKEDYGLGVVIVDDRKPNPLTEDMRAILFQACRELLINVAKHAGTETAWVTIGRDENRLCLTVEDRGRGVDLSENTTGGSWDRGFGLFNIRERIRHLGGEVTFESSPGQGTRVTLWVAHAVKGE